MMNLDNVGRYDGHDVVLATVIVFHHSVDAKDHLSPPHCTSVHQPGK
jgi:hypothetical protein